MKQEYIRNDKYSNIEEWYQKIKKEREKNRYIDR